MIYPWSSLSEIMDHIAAQHYDIIKDGQLAPKWLPAEGGVYRKYHIGRDDWAFSVFLSDEELEEGTPISLMRYKMRSLPPKPEGKPYWVKAA